MKKRNWFWMTLFLGMLAAMAPLSTDMYLPALPAMQADFGVSTSQIQMTLTMTLIGMALGQVCGGPLSDYLGRKCPLLVGMLVFVISSLGCVFASNIYVLLGWRFLAGFSGSFGIVIARAVARDLCEGATLTRFFAILMMVNGLAPILSPVIGGQILLFTTWHGIFILLTAIGIALVAGTCIYRETLPAEARQPGVMATLRKYPQLLHDRYFMGHCLLQCFVFGAFFAYIGGSSFVFQNVFGVSAQVYSLIFGSIGVGLMMAGSLPARLAGKVADVVMLKYSIRLQLIGSLALLAAFLLEAPLAAVLPILFLTLVPLSVLGAASFSLALARQGRNAGSASAMLGFFQMFLGAIMMPLVGLWGSDTAIPMGIFMTAGFALGNVAFQIMVLPDKSNQKVQPRQ